MKNQQTRRTFLKNLILAGTGIFLPAWIGYKLYRKINFDINEIYGPYPPKDKLKPLKLKNSQAQRPNILLIYCDDLGYGDLGCYGNKVIHTPNIDKLAKNGCIFENFYSCSAVCAPARAGLLTGRYPFRTGIIGNPFPKKEPFGRKLARNFGMLMRDLGSLDLKDDVVAEGLPEEEITIAEALKFANYKTALIGKWHLGDYSYGTEFHPLNHGFDYYYGVPHSNDMRPFPVYENFNKVEEDLYGKDQSFLTKTYTEKAINFINSCVNSSFFLYLAHTFPHQPLWPSSEFQGKSMGGKYGDTIEEIDYYIGKLVDYLKNKNLYKNTIIFFTSDNGPWFEGSTGSLRGRKGQSNEGGFKVSFIANWPSRIKPKFIKTPAMNIDLFPTILELSGIELPQDRIIDGKSLIPVLLNSKKILHNELYFYHYHELIGIRSGKWKYYRKIDRYTWPVPLDSASIPNFLGKDQLGERWPLLYDIEKDPSESYNLIHNFPNVHKELEHKMQIWEELVQQNPRGFII